MVPFTDTDMFSSVIKSLVTTDKIVRNYKMRGFLRLSAYLFLYIKVTI